MGIFDSDFNKFGYWFGIYVLGMEGKDVDFVVGFDGEFIGD